MEVERTDGEMDGWRAVGRERGEGGADEWREGGKEDRGAEGGTSSNRQGAKVGGGSSHLETLIYYMLCLY